MRDVPDAWDDVERWERAPEARELPWRTLPRLLLLIWRLRAEAGPDPTADPEPGRDRERDAGLPVPMEPVGRFPTLPYADDSSTTTGTV